MLALAAHTVDLQELRVAILCRCSSPKRNFTRTFGMPSPAMCAPDDASWNMMLYVPIRTLNLALSGSLRWAAPWEVAALLAERALGLSHFTIYMFIALGSLATTPFA